MGSKKASAFGLFGGCITIILWIVFSFYNPYNSAVDNTDAATTTFIMLCLPAVLAIVSVLLPRKLSKWTMLIAFIWSFPASLYFTLNLSVFSLFGLTAISYLISFTSMRVNPTV